jgi:glycosyltransferase involved in cell wall biosynthesis
LVHDFSGHPFQIDLSRRLAERGVEVLHVHCPSYVTGKGRLQGGPHLQVEELALHSTFARYSPLRRLVQECSYGVRFTRVAARFDPQVLLSCNDPLLAKTVAGVWCRWRRLPWVFWLQDLYSVAMSRALERRGGRLGRLVGAGLRRLERALLRSAGGVVAITEDFLTVLEGWGVDRDQVEVIENWAPIEELPVRERDNEWRRSLGLTGRHLLVYSGTLGLKHNPDVLYDLARALGPEADVVVVSEGLGVDHLRDRQAAEPLSNLHLVPFQPYERLPDVLGAADLLVVLLEPEAGAFSVPSKVLTCLCAGRPILAVMPEENLAARTLTRVGAGRVVPPGDAVRLAAEARSLLMEPALRHEMGQKGRGYAEATFDGERIAERFASVLARARTGAGEGTGREGTQEPAPRPRVRQDG